MVIPDYSNGVKGQNDTKGQMVLTVRQYVIRLQRDFLKTLP